ncbi:uncharacterized protein [Lolium perenne]|uniref:uncharacterized protein n=1 Tax=Lolium perenne TaxID=4522 RepID=UPI0021F5C447|nr:uncharacterized protein LOC127347268 [Lolium perenne]
MNKTLSGLFSMLKTAEVKIKKEHQVLMVNKTINFKKQGKPRKKVKFNKGGKKADAPPKKPKVSPKPDIVCYYCKGDGHCKRNCSKYLADLKRGNIKKKVKFDIHVIDVWMSKWRSSMFLNGDIEEELYMVQPKGFVDSIDVDKKLVFTRK